MSTSKENEHVFDEVEPATTSTLSKMIKTAMTKLVEEMYLVSSIYDSNFKVFGGRVRNSRFRELNRMVDFSLANTSYMVYGMSTSNDMKSIEKVERDVMRPEAHPHVFRCSLQAWLCFMVLAFGKTK